MLIQVIRSHSDDKATRSHVYVDGEFFCYGLEDVIREQQGVPVAQWKVYGETAIPAGIYACELVQSPRFKRCMIHVKDVPGFTGILIHNGKGPESTEGCLLVSDTPEFNYSRNAMVTLEKLVGNAIRQGEKVEIQYLNPTSQQE